MKPLLIRLLLMKPLFLIVFILASLSLRCLERRSVPEYGLSKEETLRINILGEPPSLDWHKASDTTSALITGNIMEGLVAIDLNDPHLRLLPALATRWESLNQSQKWIFTLRKGVVWTDGVKLTPQHVSRWLGATFESHDRGSLCLFSFWY